MDARPGHAYRAPTSSDSRSPCPALNAAANHGYLPHDGKNLSLLQLTKAVHTLYNLTWPLAFMLALGGILMCGNKFRLTVDLAALDQHGKVEHDASLVHQDKRDGDYVHPNKVLLDELVAQSSDGRGLTLEDFAKARLRRQARIPGGKLDRLHSKFAGGESVLAVQVVGDGNEIGVEHVKEWFGGEKLPHGWMPNGHMGIITLGRENRKFGKMIEEAKKSEKL
ncbi:peroxidase family 2 domain protein [Ceratobasidium sp. AG-Ba]|nr:peroxidase family 2 domain protein [Ceratobasidium sp. AG-Ba]